MKRLIALSLSLLLLAACGGARPPQSSNGVDGEYYSADAPMATPTPTDPSAPRAPGAPQKPEIQGEILIGLLAPLSGPQEAIGKQLRDAALMGLYDKQKTLSRMQMTRNPELIIRDTGTTPDQVKKATEEVIEAGAQVILGPLLAEDVRAAGEIALKHSVPLIAFSNNQDVAKPGVYVFGFSPEQQIERVAEYALAQKVEHYAALAPQSDYGRKVVRDLSARLTRQGLSLNPVEFFADGELPNPVGLQRVIDEASRWGEKRKAILLPMTGEALADTAYKIMTAQNINSGYVKLLGTGLWDDPQITSLPTLQGAWFATSEPEQTERFNEKFRATYGREPLRLASLAYDAVALVTTLALENGEKAFDAKTLTTRQGFIGPINGVFRLNFDGKAERALTVVEIGNGGFRVVDPAPARF